MISHCFILSTSLIDDRLMINDWWCTEEQQLLVMSIMWRQPATLDWEWKAVSDSSITDMTSLKTLKADRDWCKARETRSLEAESIGNCYRSIGWEHRADVLQCIPIPNDPYLLDVVEHTHSSLLSDVQIRKHEYGTANTRAEYLSMGAMYVMNCILH